MDFKYIIRLKKMLVLKHSPFSLKEGRVLCPRDLLEFVYLGLFHYYIVLIGLIDLYNFKAYSFEMNSMKQLP
jgi:hypothetical protein